MSRIVNRLVQGDQRPVESIQLWDEDANVAVDISAASTVVTKKFRLKGSTTILQTIVGDKVPGFPGLVTFTYPTNALNVAAGTYESEYSVSFNGAVQTCLDIVTHPLREDF